MHVHVRHSVGHIFGGELPIPKLIVDSRYSANDWAGQKHILKDFENAPL